MISTGTNSVKVKKQNRKTILSILKENEALSVADAARLTGLSIATCATSLSELVDHGEALVLDEKKSQGGRPARRFSFNPDQFLIAALFLKATEGKETLEYSVANANGGIIESGGGEKNQISILDIEELIARLSGKHPKLRSIAVSVPGVVKDGLIDFCDIPALVGVRLEERIQATSGLTVVADNDINFAATGYFKTNENRNIASAVYMYFPNHIYMGAGIIINGSLIRGKTSFAGELSFIPFDGAQHKGARRLPLAEDFVQYVAKLSVTVTAVIDPDIIVLSGEKITPGIRNAVGEACLDHIPAKHLPEIAVSRENDTDLLAGMVAMAVDICLANEEKGE